MTSSFSTNNQNMAKIRVSIYFKRSHIQINNYCVNTNPYLTNGFSHHYQLGESTFIFRDIRGDFKFSYKYLMKIRSANRVAAFCGVTSGAILFANVPQKGHRA